MDLVCCNRDNLYGHSFIVIVSQIIICQFINFTPQITIVLPKILLSKNSSYGSRTEWINRTFATINVFSFYDILCFSFLLTLNRFVAIILPKCNVLFESTKLYFVLFFAWLIVFALTFVDFYYCTRSFQVSRLRWIRDCSKQSSDRGHVFLIFFYSWELFLSLVIFAMYCAIISTIRHRFSSINSEAQTTDTRYGRYRMSMLENIKRERSMLILAAMTSGSLIISVILVGILPMILVKAFCQEGLITMHIVTNLNIILGRCVLPTAFFLTNKRARKYLRSRLRNSVANTTHFQVTK
uniref:G-protein coupled receptors family 1 profile domain-containing protein n=1 Tax=Wuchereria bancrofti TaxID=6293 RepID=A0AAF5PRC3_WUCBA